MTALQPMARNIGCEAGKHNLYLFCSVVPHFSFSHFSIEPVEDGLRVCILDLISGSTNNSSKTNTSGRPIGAVDQLDG